MENLIKIRVPVSVSYPALEGVLQQQFVGEYIPKPEEDTETSPYAQILDVGIAGSSAGANTVIVRVQLKILRTVLKRDKVDLYAAAILAYDNASQQLFVQKFSMESRTSSGFYNTALEVLVNKVAYNQIIQKARVDLKVKIAEEVKKVNARLEEGLELKGLKLKGAVEEVGVQDIVAHTDRLALTVEMQGNLEVAVYDLASLLPGREV